MSKNVSKITFPQTHPVLISLSLVFSYTPKPLVETLKNHKAPFVDKKKSELIWEKEFQTLYIPLFQFLYEQRIPVSIVVTGHFLDVASQYYPEFMEIIDNMLKKKLVYIIPDAYWGSSYLSMYYFDWWKDEIEGTMNRIKEYFDITPTSVYLPLLYRQLPVEKLMTSFGMVDFVTVVDERKNGTMDMPLKAFRRFHGGRVTWIREVEKTDIHIHWFIHNHYFDLMNVKNHKTIELMTKSIGLEIALACTKAELMKTKSKKPALIRIQEERNWSRYHNLEKAVFRLWEYATYMLGKEHAQIDTIDDDPLMRNLFYSMNRDFLYYLGYDNYTKKQDIPFTSPYESFIHIQNTIIQLEILLNQRESS